MYGVYLNMQLKKGGSGLDYVILLSQGGGWVLITVNYGGGSGVKMANKMIT